ncbi:hypothetical protein ACSFBF_07075 [Variovorax sp. ZT5P49]|uniref:hypothetical protein n=1 Tax=Variovorax sp. ZT5P49 TaxID=3443733 RepID=UPI003F470488
MNTPTRTRPGHWADQRIPNSDEIAEADEQHDEARPPVVAVGTAFVALLLAVALVAWLARFFLQS